MPKATETRIRRALISVSDKSGLTELGQALARHDIDILSTGGSAQTLREAGVPVTDVADHTGFPEIMGGRVKTLHPTIHGGILSRRGHEGDEAAMAMHNIDAIDLVVINLYPFEQTVAAEQDYATCVENIDIGGPAMIRAAAKNHAAVTIVTDPDDYEDVIAAIEENGGSTTEDYRARLAAKAFARTAAYDSAITAWLSGALAGDLPNGFAAGGARKQVLRYGENPQS